MAGWTGKKMNVMYSKPEEPSFLKKFKERVGYKEDGGLSDKFATMPEATGDDVEDKDDELPQVVSLKAGDLTQEEYERLRAEGKLDDLLDDGECKVDLPVQGPKLKEEEPPPEGKILFRKPTKRSGDDEGSKEDGKKLKSDGKTEKKSKKDKRKEKQKMKLLSFNEDDEEED